MDLSVAFLGTGGAVPSARRSTASLLVSRGGERLMFDCGEGTQRQLQRSVGLVQIDEIFLTHFHADHFLGLPGLLKTYDLTDREAPLTIYGPRGLRDLFKTLGRLIGRIGYELELVELEPGDAMPLEAPRSAPSRSSTACAPTATRWSRRSAPAASTPRRRSGSACRKAPPSPRSSAARRSQAPTGRFSPEQVMGEAAPRPHDRDHRRHRPLRGDRRGRRAAPSCSSTTPASPRRRRSAPPRPATRRSARRPRSPARPR